MKIFKKENKYRKQIYIYIAILIFVIVLTIILPFVFDSFSLCGSCGQPLAPCHDGVVDCYEMNNNILATIFSFFVAIFFSLIPFLALNSKIYRSWRKYAIVSLPIMIFLIATSPESGGGGMGAVGSVNREWMTMNLSVLFFIITLLIIIYKSIRLKFTKKAEKR